MKNLESFARFFPELGEELWCFKEVSRGMELAKRFLLLFPERANGRIIFAERITRAKGRFERRWFAEKGGLWLAISIYDEFILRESLSLLSFIPALAVCKTVESLYKKKLSIKWINDVHFEGKKIAGVLMEKWKDWYVIGIGINLNNSCPKGIPCLSLKEFLGREIEIFGFLGEFVFWMSSFLGFLRIYENSILREEPVGENLLFKEYLKFCDTIGRCVYFNYNIEEEGGLFGMVKDIKPSGEIVIEGKEGAMCFSSGEILYLF